MEYHTTSWRRSGQQKYKLLVDKLQDGYRTKSIMNDLKQDGISSVFSEAPRPKIKEMGNVEENELGETVRTTQCSSCLRYYKERTVYSLCCKCLMTTS